MSIQPKMLKLGAAARAFAACAAAIGACAIPAFAQKQAATAQPTLIGAERTALPIPAGLDRLDVMQVILRPSQGDGVVLRGPGCPQTIASHTNANFGGGQFVVQAGFAEQEIAAASYQLDPEDFPIKIDLMEFILATSGATQQTTTQWSVLVWDGNPQTGTLVAEYSSDDVILPHARVGPGTAGVNIQVSVDPGDPEQIFIFNESGTNTFSIGFRIDNHNNQTANPCFTAPPSNSNAFPTTDVGGLQNPTRNWLFGVNCGPFGCPANGGWATFQGLIQLCRPSGDWVMRATWSSVNCEPDATGSCCVVDGSCVVVTNAECQLSGGIWTQEGSCTPNNCPQPFGRCCLPDGSCQILEQATCSAQQGAWAFGQTCDAACPQPTGACCFGSSCQMLEPAVCTGFGGTFIGINVQCNGSACPLGACCLPDGSCLAGVSAPACAGMGGVYQGNDSTCSPNNCPQPTGACCSSSNFCFAMTQANCIAIPGATWQGPLTVCEPNPCGAAQTGACCTGSACIITTADNCSGEGMSFSGSGTTCNEGGNNTTPCCRADFNQDDDLAVPDIFAFLSAWFGGSDTANFDGEGETPTVPDIFAFLSAWFAGCD